VTLDHGNPNNGVQPSPDKPKLLSPKRALSVGTWNVRIKHQSQLLILVAELEQWSCDIIIIYLLKAQLKLTVVIGISETYRTGTEELSSNEYKFIGQGKNDALHRSGVGLLLRKEALKALCGYNPIPARIIVARFK